MKRRETDPASNQFPKCPPPSEIHRDSGREEKGEEGDRGGQEDKRGEQKGGRQVQPVISSLSVLHCVEHTEIHRVG